MLKEVSDMQANGETDIKNLNSMINIVMLIGSKSKQQLLKKDIEISKLKKQLSDITARLK
jgi:hypothetical protein